MHLNKEDLTGLWRDGSSYLWVVSVSNGNAVCHRYDDSEHACFMYETNLLKEVRKFLEHYGSYGECHQDPRRVFVRRLFKVQSVKSD